MAISRNRFGPMNSKRETTDHVEVNLCSCWRNPRVSCGVTVPWIVNSVSGNATVMTMAGAETNSLAAGMRIVPKGSAMLDRLHKGVVIVCLGMTLYGTLLLGNKVANYFINVRPQIEARKRREQAELLAEGRSNPDKASVITD
ncbi:hypothetical protein AAG570_005007 [Ranatra chinensis]|uniref:Uncharacterized protein n=1 Tax=Ranatra chinensis TaxID=642074 RepID=A0ABD0Y0S9_9HEMI